MAILSRNIPLNLICSLLLAFGGGGLFWGWFYTVGTHLHKKLPADVKMPVKLFQWLMLIPLLYMILVAVTVINASNAISYGRAPGASLPFMIPLHFVSVFCVFYAIHFIAKTLKAVELQRPVVFRDYVREFFAIWFFIFGIWSIQRRLNALFGNKNTKRSYSSNDQIR